MILVVPHFYDFRIILFSAFLNRCEIQFFRLSISKVSIKNLHQRSDIRNYFCHIVTWFSYIGLIHTRHFGTQYWDKKIILSHMFQWLTKVSSKKTYLEPPWIVLFVYLPSFIFLLRAYLGLKISMAQKYIFIAILCIKMSRVNKALSGKSLILSLINSKFSHLMQSRKMKFGIWKFRTLYHFCHEVNAIKSFIY